MSTTRRGGSRPWRTLVAQVVRRDRGICHLCTLPGATSADHLVPVAHGGKDTPANLAAAHLRCNQVRGTRSIEDARADLTPSEARGWGW